MDDFRDTLGARLVAAGRSAADTYGARLVTLGLRAPQVRLLTEIAVADGASQNELATRLAVTPGFIVGLADELEAMGALTRERDRNDRRRQVLTLTGHGVALLGSATRAAQELDGILTRELSSEALEQFERSLAVVVASLVPNSSCEESVGGS